VLGCRGHEARKGAWGVGYCRYEDSLGTYHETRNFGSLREEPAGRDLKKGRRNIAHCGGHCFGWGRGRDFGGKNIGRSKGGVQEEESESSGQASSEHHGAGRPQSVHLGTPCPRTSPPLALAH